MADIQTLKAQGYDLLMENAKLSAWMRKNAERIKELAGQIAEEEAKLQRKEGKSTE